MRGINLHFTLKVYCQTETIFSPTAPVTFLQDINSLFINYFIIIPCLGAFFFSSVSALSFLFMLTFSYRSPPLPPPCLPSEAC